MAVGNFKRQGGRRLRPAPISPARTFATVRTNQFQVPGIAISIGRDKPDSWRELEASLKGSGPATTTTLLSALWPDSHHILDWRVLAAVTGLAIASGAQVDLDLPDPKSHEQVPVSLLRYAKVRELLSGIAKDTQLPLVTVERALYRLTVPVTGKGKNWQDYGGELKKGLDMPSTQTTDDDGTPDDEDDVPPQAP